MEGLQLGTGRVQPGLLVGAALDELLEELSLGARAAVLRTVAVHNGLALAVELVDHAQLVADFVLIPLERAEVALFKVELVVFEHVLHHGRVDELRLDGGGILLHLGDGLLVRLDVLDRRGELHDVILLNVVPIGEEPALLVELVLEDEPGAS